MAGIMGVREGTPLAHRVSAGNAPDATAFLMEVKDMRNRFGIERVLVVGDRGMFNAEVLSRIEEPGIEYIAGMKMRQGRDVREVAFQHKTLPSRRN